MGNYNYRVGFTQLVVLDAQRNKNREALRQLYTKSKHKTRPEKSRVALGKTFHKMNTQECIDMLEMDQKAINKEINQLQDEVKKKVFELNKMEGKSTAKGFDLKSMKYEDLTNIVEQLN